MSFRELRNFCEIMRALGYHRNISMENFRDPNFELVADILFWFAQRYDPKMDISDDIEDEKDRVSFIRQVCQLFATKARITLNPKKLYEATGFAVKELLKIASMMYKAMQSSENMMDDEDMSGQNSMIDFNTSSKLHNLKAARQLASEITESGAKLFDLLGQEKDLKQSRDKALEFLDSISRNLDTNTEQVYIEKCIGNIIDNQSKKMKEMEDTVKQLKLDESELLNKLARRKQEYERAEKRLKGIENVKPEYQEEYERLEAELEKYYTVYVEKFTNIDYLEHELDMYNLKDSQRRLKQQEVIDKFKNQQKKAEKEEIFNDEREEEDAVFGQHDQMRQTQNGFGKKWKPGDDNQNIGGLQQEEEDSDEEEGVEDEDEDDDDNIGQDDDDEESDHNF